ncbi:MAG: AtpZ/AtpI family protein [Deltaproteobacteria bacterium]|nr:MAG: AtpZ/AtpI family protein [Deltaproteobacteria bacterium]TMQ14603.1 MAG: AtpZ/AtpI family protein [Deltaproteobacteria bacterium]
MPTGPTHSGDLSQNSGVPPAHHSPVTPTPTPGSSATPTTVAGVSPAARRGRQFYNVLSASSVGLELGLSVVFGVLIGRWLDGKLGTEPWLMLVLLGFGLVAGYRSVMRAVRRAERAAEAEARHG